MGADLRFWAIPLTVLVVIGAVAGATIGWQAGLLPVAVAAGGLAVLLLLNHGKVRAWQAEQQDGRRRTARLLRRPAGTGYRVFRERAIPGEAAGELEHLVVGPTGVYLLVSRTFPRRIPIRARHKDLFHGPQSQRALLDRAAGQAREAADSLGAALRQRVDVTPALVIHGPDVPWKVLTIRGVAVFSGKRLARYLRGRRRLSTVEIERIAGVVDRVFPPRDDAQRQPVRRHARQPAPARR